MKKKMQTHLFWILLIYLAVGWIYPVIGFWAILCMLAPIIMASYKGRYWCGNYCPRGSFYDHILAEVSPKRQIPAIFHSTIFRLVMVILIFFVFGFQMYHAWNDFSAMGAVFIRIILMTTLVGVGLGLLYHQRSWCSFCPMGTLASWLSKKPKPMPLLVESSCVGCKLCTTVCPSQLSPYTARTMTEGFTHSDCLKCSRCIEKCPEKAIHFNQAK